MVKEEEEVMNLGGKRGEWYENERGKKKIGNKVIIY